MPLARVVFYASTLAALCVPVAAYLGHGLALSATLAAIFIYSAYVTCGVVFSSWGMFADVVTHGPRNTTGVALTFDDGPDPATTLPLLDWLDDHHIVATFFVIGHKVDKYPEVVREIHRRGHDLGVHSYAHSRTMSFYPPGRVRRDLKRAMEAMQLLTEQRPRFFRAPIGHISPAMARVLRELDLIAVGWSARGYDGLASATAKTVAHRIGRGLRDGAIVLMHDASERGDFTPVCLEALTLVHEAVRRRNLSYVPLSGWLKTDTNDTI